MPKSAEAKTAAQSSEKRTKRSQSRGKKEEQTPTASLDLRTILEVPKPQKARSAWTYFLAERLAQLPKTEDQKKGELFKLVSLEWQKLEQAQKAKYEQLAESDKARHKQQMAQFDEEEFFTMEDGQLSYLAIPKKPKFLDTVVQPSKPKSSFVYFMSEKRQDVLQKTPDLKAPQVFKIAAEQWNKVDEQERKRFDEMSLKDRERYDKQLNDLLTLGYFTMADGSKSSDHVRKVKQKRHAMTEEEKQEDTVSEKPKSTKSLKRKATDVDKDEVVSPFKRKAVSKDKDAKSSLSPTPKSPKKKVADDEKAAKTLRSRSRSKSPQKKPTDLKLKENTITGPVHKPKLPKEAKSPKVIKSPKKEAKSPQKEPKSPKSPKKELKNASAANKFTITKNEKSPQEKKD